MRNRFALPGLIALFALVVLAVVHVWLHWSWVCATLASVAGVGRPSAEKQRTWGLGAALVLSRLLSDRRLRLQETLLRAQLDAIAAAMGDVSTEIVDFLGQGG